MTPTKMTTQQFHPQVGLGRPNVSADPGRLPPTSPIHSAVFRAWRHWTNCPSDPALEDRLRVAMNEYELAYRLRVLMPPDAV